MTSSSDQLPFFDKLSARISAADSLLCIGLDPNPDNLPQRFRNRSTSIADQVLAWNLSAIEATAEYAAVYKPNIAFYESQGAAGYALLEATLAAIPSDIPVILDAKRGDIGSTAEAYAQACFDQLGVDAVTLSPYLGRDSIQPFIEYDDKGLFVLCHTSNPGSSDFQELEISDWRTLDREGNQPLFMHIARRAVSWSQNIGLVVGATYPESIRAIRDEAPEAWLLIPGIGSQGGDLAATLAAGLRADGSGLVINVSRGVCQADDPSAAAKQFRDDINRAKQSAMKPSSSGRITVDRHPHTEFFASLVELGAVQFGEFTLASGIQSPLYIDLRLLVSAPNLLAQTATLYAQKLESVSCDRIAGVPYAALPIGTAVSMTTGIPMIYPRKEIKSYGLQRGIEGAWDAGDKVAIIEDLVTKGGSTINTVQRLREAGMLVEDAVVLIDRQQGGAQNLVEEHIRLHSVFTLTEILDSLLVQGKVSAEKAEAVRHFVRDSVK